MSTKQEVQAILANLPDTCTLEDVQYRLYVAAKVKNSIDEAEREGSIPHEEVEARMKRWTSQ